MKHDYTKHLVILLFIAAVILLAGLGLRDPWPADEPRFALIARDMAEGGNWLLPRIGGVLYPDKPPFFFWLVAALYAISGSLRAAFLLPGFLAGIGTLLLVTDIARRLWGPRTAIWCGATLLALVQFPLQMKSGQIDGTLCFLTTASLYGMSRHLLLGPDWRWYAAGGFFAGLGIITKGVGFLPLLILVPYAWAARSSWSVTTHRGAAARWLLAPAMLLMPVLLWLVPMLIAAAGNPDAAAYRDNILFHQTITRYADSWGHVKPPWYLFTNAIPWLWLPASFLLPWLIPVWRRDLRARNPAILLYASWVVLVLLFFSLSDGKRSLYIFPAAPAFALIVGYHAEHLVRRAGVQRLLVAIPATLGLGIVMASVYAVRNPHDLDAWIPGGLLVIKISAALFVTGAAMLVVVLLTRRRRALVAYAGSMLALWLGISLLVAPVIDGTRSGRDLIGLVQAAVGHGETLAFVAWPEQFLLQWPQPAYHFGFRRDPDADVQDAVRWLKQSPGRRALVPSTLLDRCFDPALSLVIGSAHRREWVLVSRDAITERCVSVATGPETVVFYSPPGAMLPALARQSSPANAVQARATMPAADALTAEDSYE